MGEYEDSNDTTEAAEYTSNCFICNSEVLGLNRTFLPLSISNGNALCDMFRLPPLCGLFDGGLILFCLSCGDQVEAFHSFLAQLNTLLQQMEEIRQHLTQQLLQSSTQTEPFHLVASRHILVSHLLGSQPSSHNATPEFGASRISSSEESEHDGLVIVEDSAPEVEQLVAPPTITQCHVPNLLEDLIQTELTEGPDSSQLNDEEISDSAVANLKWRKSNIDHKSQREFICPVCHKSFGKASRLRVHDRSVHQRQKPHPCSECGKCFGHKSSLTDHLQAVHRKEKPHSCQVCGKCFSHKGTLTVHMRSHSGVKPFNCPKCESVFSYQSSLNQHVKSVHRKEKPHSCLECGKSFSQSGGLSYHILSYHRKEKPHCCSQCGSSFTVKAELNIHTRIHRGDRPFTCGECGIAFRHKDHFTAQMRTQDLERTQACTSCNNRYAHLQSSSSENT